MTAELLMAIAMLCGTPNYSSNITYTKGEVLKCQQDYIKCTHSKVGSYKKDNRIPPIPYDGFLVNCVLEKTETF